MRDLCDWIVTLILFRWAVGTLIDWVKLRPYEGEMEKID